jgi:hypothetical protein
MVTVSTCEGAMKYFPDFCGGVYIADILHNLVRVVQ